MQSHDGRVTPSLGSGRRASDLLNCEFMDGINAPDLDFAIDDEIDAVNGELIGCLCWGERVPASKAFRLGCDQHGGCPELRDSMNDVTCPTGRTVWWGGIGCPDWSE